MPLSGFFSESVARISLVTGSILAIGGSVVSVLSNQKLSDRPDPINGISIPLGISGFCVAFIIPLLHVYIRDREGRRRYSLELARIEHEDSLKDKEIRWLRRRLGEGNWGEYAPLPPDHKGTFLNEPDLPPFPEEPPDLKGKK